MAGELAVDPQQRLAVVPDQPGRVLDVAHPDGGREVGLAADVGAGQRDLAAAGRRRQVGAADVDGADDGADVAGQVQGQRAALGPEGHRGVPVDEGGRADVVGAVDPSGGGVAEAAQPEERVVALRAERRAARGRGGVHLGGHHDPHPQVVGDLHAARRRQDPVDARSRGSGPRLGGGAGEVVGQVPQRRVGRRGEVVRRRRRRRGRRPARGRTAGRRRAAWRSPTTCGCGSWWPPRWTPPRPRAARPLGAECYDTFPRLGGLGYTATRRVDCTDDVRAAALVDGHAAVSFRTKGGALALDLSGHVRTVVGAVDVGLSDLTTTARGSEIALPGAHVSGETDLPATVRLGDVEHPARLVGHDGHALLRVDGELAGHGPVRATVLGKTSAPMFRLAAPGDETGTDAPEPGREQPPLRSRIAGAVRRVRR